MLKKSIKVVSCGGNDTSQSLAGREGLNELKKWKKWAEWIH